MANLKSIEKTINSELSSKIISSKIKHNQIYINIEDNDLIEVILFLKTKMRISLKSQKKSPKK